MRRALIAATLIVAAFALVATGCGGDDDEDTTAATTEETTTEETGTGTDAGAQSVDVSMGEYFFDPDGPTVAEGGTLAVVNDGEIVHNLTVEDEDVASADLESGESEDLTVDLAAGDYPFLCTIPGHAEQGMTGTLTVE